MKLKSSILETVDDMKDGVIDEAVTPRVGSTIRHGVATSKTNKGRQVILSRNSRIKHIEDDIITTTSGVKLNKNQQVGSRSNIEQHGDWHIIKEERTAHRIIAKVDGNKSKWILNHGTGGHGREISRSKKKLAINVYADSKESAINKAGTALSKRGYKIHSLTHDGIVSEGVKWKYLTYQDDDEARKARKIHLSKGTGDPARRIQGNKIAYAGTFHGPKPGEPVREARIYDDSSVYTGGHFNPNRIENPNALWKNHAHNYKMAQFFHKNAKSPSEKIDASKDMDIASRKMSYWEKHPNFDRRQQERDQKELNRTWKESVEVNESSFGDAFSAARKSGKEIFTFNGKSYTTRQKGESDSQWKSSLSSVKSKEAPTPAPRIKRPGDDSSTAPKGPIGRGHPTSSTSSSGATGPANRGRHVPSVSSTTIAATGPSNRGRPEIKTSTSSGATGPMNRGKVRSLSSIDINKRVSNSIRPSDGAVSAVMKAADRARLQMAVNAKASSMRGSLGESEKKLEDMSYEELKDFVKKAKEHDPNKIISVETSLKISRASRLIGQKSPYKFKREK